MKPTKPQIIAIITPFVTLAAGYLGFEPIQELRQPPAVTVNVPEHVQQPHTHPKHSHKDWLPEIQKAIKDNNDIYH